jgi:hypothetical protein
MTTMTPINSATILKKDCLDALYCLLFSKQ